MSGPSGLAQRTDPAAAIAAAVGGGERSAVEVVEEHLDRIEAHDGEVRAFTLVLAEEARAAAAAVDAAVAAGAEVLHEPRVWPEYHPDYYGAFVRDPDGHNVEAVCHSPAA